MADIIVRPISSTSVNTKVVNTEPVVITVSEGFIGPPGRAATATVGTTTTGATGTNASVTNVGTVFDAVFDFVIPKGDAGDAATIAVGTVTALTPDQNPTVSNSGTSGAAVFDFGLPAAATLDLGTVTIVDPDQNPSITDVGTSGNVVFDINIPRAADVTVQSAVTLTPDQSPSIADNGTNGDVDLTFSIPRAAAVNINPVTTVNPDVNPSVADTGVDGDVDLTFSIPRAAALDLGTITVVNPDQNPAITDVGIDGDAEFNFSLPRAATITLGTTNVLTPDQDPSVADTGTDGDALYTFSIPRAAVLSLGNVSALNPDQNPTVTSTVTSGDVAYNFSIPRAATVTVGSVTTESAGSPASVTNVGTNGDVTLDFGIPQGDKGDQGDAATITLGTVSVVDPDQNPAIVNSGTSSDATFDFDLPRAADVSLGTVTTINPDQNPTITDSGVGGDVVLDIELPRAPQFSVGNVVTGNAGTNVIINDVGVDGDIELDFTIPKGDKGDTGAALNILGTLNNTGELPALGNPGDAYIIGGDLYVWSESANDWIDAGNIAGPGVAAGGTTDQYLVKLSNTDFDTGWETLTANRVSYNNTNSNLTSTNVQTAIDELDSNKLDISALTASVRFFPTTAAGAVAGYNKLVTDTADADFDDPAVDVTVGPFSGTGQLLGSLVSDAGVLEGNTTPINVSTIGNVRRTSGNTNDSASFYFEVYKRDSGGVETLIGTSSNTATVFSSSYEEFFADSLIQDTNFTATDKVVLKFYGNVVAGGGGETYQFQYGGSQPVRTLFPVPVSVVPSNSGTIATQDADNVNISGGSITGITDLAVADGGTGASDAATARNNLGLGSVPNLDTTDAVNKAHDQNTDTALDQGGANEVTAADARAHIDSTSNPHGVTKTQVGLGDVDNVNAANLRDRSTHTGTQPISSVSGLQSDLDGKVPQTAATGSAEIPAGTQGERDGTPSAGYFRFNTDSSQFEGYDGSSWGEIGGGAGATGGGDDEVFIQNDQIVTADYTIPADKNALTTGPIEIDSNVTVTVSSGSRWVVL